MAEDHRAASKEFLRRVLKETGWSPYQLAKKAGVSSTTITRPLNDKAYKGVPKWDTLSKIGRAAGIELPDILKTNESMDMTPIRGSIPVLGDVRAGSWERIPDEPVIEEWLDMDVPQYAGATLFALRVVGRSMDLVFPDGTHVVVVPPAEAGLRVGDKVVVRRRDSTGKVETTLKELVRRQDGSMWLEPRSTDASQEPIPVHKGDEHNQDGAEVIGVVVHYQAAVPRGSGPIVSL